jgi:hypothetical protein
MKALCHTALIASLVLVQLTSAHLAGQTITVAAKNSTGGAPAFFEDISLHRIQIKLTTARKEGSENDQGVFVQMSEHDAKFFLSKAIDNFERGHTDTYDFLSPTINRIRDIEFLRLGVKGDDGWRVQKVQVYFNNVLYPVFEKDFGNDGYSLDNAAFITIPGSELRASPNWSYTLRNKNDIWRSPQYLSKSTLINMVEAAIGDQLTQRSGFKWGTTSGLDTRSGDVVEASYKDFNTLHFDLDLARTVSGPNPEVDVDFDLDFSCENGTLKLELENVKFSTNYVGQIQEYIRNEGSKLLGKAIGTYFGQPEAGQKAGGILANFLDFGIEFSPNSISNFNSCKDVVVLPSGNLKLY